jgi:imidazole glycerol-phosphate synthase subunit HisH
MLQRFIERPLRSKAGQVIMIIIVDYAAGNLTSVKRALDYLNVPSVISPDPKDIASAERIIFPGVGHAGTAMQNLRKRNLDKALKDAFAAGTPILGICLGAQIILEYAHEGDIPCLGLIPGEVPRFKLSDSALKIPHMGWDSIRITRDHPVLRDIKQDDEFYFVHSYYPKPSDGTSVIATCDYEIEFAAAVGTKNLVGTQFHPEKSGPAGLSILKNFAKWDGAPC